MPARRPTESAERYTSERGIRTRGPKAKIDPNEALLAPCWCGQNMDHIDPAIIRRGETWQCGARSCRPPN